MRIISKFRDYYDVVQKEGQDRSLIYQRDRRVVEDDKSIYLPKLEGPQAPAHMQGTRYQCRYRWANSGALGFHHDEWAIGFCGKVYTVMQIRPLLGARTIDPEGKISYCYSAQEVEDVILATADKKTRELFLGERKWRGYGTPFRRDMLDSYFAKYEELRAQYAAFFVKHRCPVFISHWAGAYWTYNHEVVFNARLEEFKFMKVFDPYRAFQEIQMFLGGLAAPEKPIPAISDKIMAEAKGFDKWSFRKEPK